jgi:hypothetical protein
MQAHEEHMARPVRDLFPRDERLAKRIKCRGCGEYFMWLPSTPRVRVYCTGECKLAHQRSLRSTPFRPSPPGAGGSGDGASGD